MLKELSIAALAGIASVAAAPACADGDAAGRIRVSHLRHGDLLFFDLQGKRNSHVGIYVGDGQFVHAPSTGKRVRKDRLDSPYWRKHLSEARRFDAVDV